MNMVQSHVMDHDLCFNVRRSMFVSMTDQSVILKKSLSSLKLSIDAFTVSHKAQGSANTFTAGTLVCCIEI